MSLTFIQLEESPEKHTTQFGLGSGFLEDYYQNPLDQLRSLECEKIDGSWNLKKIKEVLDNLNQIALQNSYLEQQINKHKNKHKKTQQLEQQIISVDYDQDYSSLKIGQNYDNKTQRINKMIKQFNNRIICKSVRPSSVQTKILQQPEKCKIVSKDIEKQLIKINNKYQQRPSTVNAKSRYKDSILINSERFKNELSIPIRPYTTQTRGDNFWHRHKSFDLDNTLIGLKMSNRKRSFSTLQKDQIKTQKNHFTIEKIMKKCDKELNRKFNINRYDLENKEVQPTFILDDSDGQIKRLQKCIKFDPLNSIRDNFKKQMPNEQDFIMKNSIKVIKERERRKNNLKQKIFHVKATNLVDF